jgi:hypothetical protein
MWFGGWSSAFVIGQQVLQKFRQLMAIFVLFFVFFSFNKGLQFRSDHMLENFQLLVKSRPGSRGVF